MSTPMNDIEREMCSYMVDLYGTSGLVLPDFIINLCINNELSLVAAWRTYRNMSQESFASKLGVRVSQVEKLERDGFIPQKRILNKIAKILEVKVEQLI